MENLQQTNQPSFFSGSLSQLDKTHLLSPKLNNSKAFEARQQPQKNLHALTHAGGFFEFEPTKHLKPVCLHKLAQSNFFKAIPLFFEQLETTKVVFHNNNFVTEIFETYHSTQAHLFLEWVKTFAIIRKAERTALTTNVIESTDDDFLTALRLFKLQHFKAKLNQFTSQKQKVWEVVLKHFTNKPITTANVRTLTPIIDSQAIGAILKEFEEEGKLKPCKKLHNCKRYELIKN